MPIYDYKCDDCGKVYDVFHKVREIAEDVICPACGSQRHVKMMSVPNVSISGGSAPAACPEGSACGMNNGRCANGMCGLE